MSLDKQTEIKITPEVKRRDLELSEKGKVETSKEVGTAEQAIKQVQPQVVTSDEGVGEPGIDSYRQPLHQEIENILEQDLEKVFFSLDEKTQEVFKQKGERTTQEIIKLVKSAKVTFKKVFKLILGWLKTIPGVNKFFLEQEAKIKADKIMKIDA